LLVCIVLWAIACLNYIITVRNSSILASLLFVDRESFVLLAGTAIQDGVQDGRRGFASMLKNSHNLILITQSNVNRFSKNFHLQISMETFYEIIKIVHLTLNAYKVLLAHIPYLRP